MIRLLRTHYWLYFSIGCLIISCFLWLWQYRTCLALSFASFLDLFFFFVIVKFPLCISVFLFIHQLDCDFLFLGTVIKTCLLLVNTLLHLFCDTVTAFSLVNCKYLLNQLKKNLTILIYRAYMNVFLLKNNTSVEYFLSPQCNIKICISSVDCFLEPSDVALLWEGFLCFFHQRSLSSAKKKQQRKLWSTFLC